jgi:hypothetical protein
VGNPNSAVPSTWNPPNASIPRWIGVRRRTHAPSNAYQSSPDISNCRPARRSIIPFKFSASRYANITSIWRCSSVPTSRGPSVDPSRA